MVQPIVIRNVRTIVEFKDFCRTYFPPNPASSRREAKGETRRPVMALELKNVTSSDESETEPEDNSEQWDIEEGLQRGREEIEQEFEKESWQEKWLKHAIQS